MAGRKNPWTWGASPDAEGSRLGEGLARFGAIAQRCICWTPERRGCRDRAGSPAPISEFVRLWRGINRPDWDTRR